MSEKALSFNPEDVVLTNEDYVRDLTTSKARDGWYHYVITKVSIREAKPDDKSYGRVALSIEVYPQKSTGTLGGPRQSMFCALPIVNPANPSYVPPEKTLTTFRSLLAAINPESFAMPELKGTEWFLNGKPFDAACAPSRRLSVAKARCEYAKTLLKDPSQLVGQSFYGRLSSQEDSSYVNINYIQAQPPYQGLVPDDMFVEEVRPDVSMLEQQSNTTAETAGTSKKKARK